MQSKSTTKRTARQSPPDRAQTHTGTKTHKTKNAAPQIEPDYTLTSQKRVVSKFARTPTQIVLKRFLSGRTLKAWRKQHGYSAHALAVELGVTRSYIKSIEGGSLAASQKFITRFNALRAQRADAPAPSLTPDTEPRAVISKYALPASFEILARPVKCKTCKHHFIPRAPRQKFCGERCARLGRKAQRKRAQQTRRRKGNAHE